MIQQAMILAAGRGQRMMPLTASSPKPLLKVQGRMLIEYHLHALAKAGVNRVIINHAWLGDMIEQALGNGERYQLEIIYSAESESLETAGGIINALPHFNDTPFWLVNGDVFTDYHFALPKGHTEAAHLVMVNNPEHHPEGDFTLCNGRLVTSQAKRLTYAGIALFEPEIFAGLSAGHRPLGPFLRSLIAQGQVSGEHWLGEWCDVGTPERLADLNKEW